MSNPKSEGYKPISEAPEGVVVSVCWGTPPRVEYGKAKFFQGKWWDFTERHAYFQGHECATPTGWLEESK